MLKFKIDKLIRDKLPEIMRQSGIQILNHIMEHEEYIKRLKDKILEEAKEVISATTKEEINEELADLLEVMISLARINEIELTDILKIAEEKRLKKGGFDKRIYAASVEIPSNHPSVDYYKNRPEEYPEEK